MDAEYFYCSSCGYEAYDIFVAYLRATANADQYKCPECGEESSIIELSDEVSSNE